MHPNITHSMRRRAASGLAAMEYRIGTPKLARTIERMMSFAKACSAFQGLAEGRAAIVPHTPVNRGMRSAKP
jgi:hypothetical protein